MVVAASVAVGTLLLLAVAWYDAVVAFGFLIFGVVFSQPALPDLVFGIVILAAALTGGGRLTLRRAPPLVVYLLGAFLVLNMLAAAWAPSLGTPVFFVATTTYLMAFGLWVSAYVDTSERARRVMGWLTIGATFTAGLSLAALFLAFPGRDLLTYYPPPARRASSPIRMSSGRSCRFRSHSRSPSSWSRGSFVGVDHGSS